MDIEQALEQLKSHMANTLKLEKGWQVDIYLWEPTGDDVKLVGIRVAEVSVATSNQGYAFMQSDEGGLTVCAQVERCLLALVLEWEENEASYELALLNGMITAKE